MIYDIAPQTKPRQTRADKWKQRPCVMRYRAFADECKAKRVDVPLSGAHVVFHIEMPKSWSKKKREAMQGKAHQQTPDIDNLLKALLDAVYTNDCRVYDIRASKVWSKVGFIDISHGGCYIRSEA